MATSVTNAPLPSPGGEKVKFTVSVRGHQWSSARHIHETLQEFAEVIQRNARRLDFIGEGDSIQRLQLARADGSDPEELDVDATLEDVIICMGSKHLVAIINSARGPPALCTACPEPGKSDTAVPISESTGLKQILKQAKNDNLSAPIPTLAQIQCDNGELPCMGVKSFSLLKHRGSPFKSACDPAGRGLKITIPSLEPAAAAFHDERSTPYGQEYGNGDRHLSPALSSRPPHVNGVAMGGNDGMPGGLLGSAATPSPAELAHFLVRGSSGLPPSRLSNGGSLNSSHLHPQGMAAHHAGFQSFAPTMLNRLPPMTTSSSSPACQAPPAPNIALLAQFLASQLRAFIPVNGTGSSLAPSSTPANALGSMRLNAPVNEVGPNLRKLPTQINSCCKAPERMDSCCPEDAINTSGKKSSRSAPGNPKASVSESHDKDESSSSANVNNTAPPSSDGIESELQHANGNRRSEMIFLVNRRSKTGVGTHHLRMSDLSAFFHLSVVDAAKKLGVSQTTLKKACRKFGLKRWPGRKVRSLESTIHGLEHTIAVGHGAGMEELTEAYMRSEVTKLQQEMDQLVHGTPVSQRSPAARTADLYKRLYSRGWRSKYHSPCNRFDLDLNKDSRDNDHAYSKGPEDIKPATKGENGGHLPRKDHGGLPQVATDLKDDSHSQTSREDPDKGNGHAKRSSKVDLDGQECIKESQQQDAVEPVEIHEIREEEYMEDAKYPTPVEEPQVNAACYNNKVEAAADHVRAEHNMEMGVQSGNNNTHLAHTDRTCAPGRSPKRPKRDCCDLAEAAVLELSMS